MKNEGLSHDTFSQLPSKPSGSCFLSEISLYTIICIYKVHLPPGWAVSPPAHTNRALCRHKRTHLFRTCLEPAGNRAVSLVVPRCLLQASPSRHHSLPHLGSNIAKKAEDTSVFKHLCVCLVLCQQHCRIQSVAEVCL